MSKPFRRYTTTELRQLAEAYNKLHDAGVPSQDMAEKLNKQGFKNTMGGPLTYNAVHGMRVTHRRLFRQKEQASARVRPASIPPAGPRGAGVVNYVSEALFAIEAILASKGLPKESAYRAIRALVSIDAKVFS